MLVSGESGSGKEFFPKIIHYFGTRKHKKYIAVNCGAIPEGTIDSELFGHEKGSFTGAISARKGYFEEADGGTIFLDEVAELPITTQARLLRVLETGEFLKVGSSTVQKTDIRIVAATNVDLLLKAVANGKFREDLYYRLSTIIIRVPNLHDRGAEHTAARPEVRTRLLREIRYRTHHVLSRGTAPDGALPMAGQRTPAQEHSGAARHFRGREGNQPRHACHGSPHADGNATPARLDDIPTYEKEREMLWKTILGLQNEIGSLRAEMASMHGDGRIYGEKPLWPTVNSPYPQSAPSSDTSRKNATWPSLPRDPRGFRKGDDNSRALTQRGQPAACGKKNSTSPRARSTAKSRSLA